MAERHGRLRRLFGLEEQPELFDPAAARRTIARLEGLGATEREYLTTRWLGMVLWWTRRARETKWKHQLLTALALVAAAPVPLLAPIDSDAARWSAFGLGITAAVCFALDRVFALGDIWRDKRDAAERLKIEGWSFFVRGGPYAGTTHADAFPVFAGRVETLIGSEIQRYVSILEQAPGPEPKPKPEAEPEPEP